MKLFLVAVLSLPVAVFAEGGLPNQPYIYVEGKAEVEKPADMVTFRFELVALNADQAKANQDVQRKAAEILGLLNDRKIAPSDIVAEDLRSQPEYENNENSQGKRGKLIGYSVTRGFVARLRDIAVFPKLVDELLTVEGVQFSGIESGLAKEKDVKNELWDKAETNAREQAEKALGTLRMRIDSVFAVSPVSFPEISTRIFSGDQERVIVTGSNIPVAEETSAPQYRLAPVTISQRVHVIYLISPVR